MADKTGEEKKVDIRSGRTLQAALLLLVIAVALGIAGSTGVAGIFLLGALACFIVSVILAPPNR